MTDTLDYQDPCTKNRVDRLVARMVQAVIGSEPLGVAEERRLRYAARYLICEGKVHFLYIHDTHPQHESRNPPQANKVSLKPLSKTRWIIQSPEAILDTIPEGAQTLQGSWMGVPVSDEHELVQYFRTHARMLLDSSVQSFAATCHVQA